MYPHLEPHGLIMRLNASPLKVLSKESVVRDRQCWDEYENEDKPNSDNSHGHRAAFGRLGSIAFRMLNHEAILYAFCEGRSRTV
jgi:hypothetical protein